MPKKFLLRHIGNMGDMVFFILPVLETLKRRYPDCHITLVTAWGFKDKKGRWGKRNLDGFQIALLSVDPRIDQLVHWRDTALSLNGTICQEGALSFPTWNKAWYEKEKKSGAYDAVYELDFGLHPAENPVTRVYAAIGLPEETYSNYQLHLRQGEKDLARAVMENYPFPRIFLLESIEGETTRGWDPRKIPALERAIQKTYGVNPIWFGGRHIPYYQGRLLTLRENIACLTEGTAGIGVLSGPLHFAAAVGLPTLTLYADQPIHRAAPAYFLNPYIADPRKKHRTLLGPAGPTMHFLKSEQLPEELTAREARNQHFKSWVEPGRQATKTGLAALTVDEVMTVLHDMLYV